MQSKLPQLAMLCLMVIEAIPTNKVMQRLLRQALQLLDKLMGLMLPSGGFPEQSLNTLLGLVRNNISR